MNTRKILDVTEIVKWIGVLDPDLVTFDVVMETKYGTTYNSYFINAAHIAVIETVKEKFWTEYYEKIRALTDPAKIEYIIVNHTEPDHSGSLKQLLEVAPGATVVGSGNAIRYLNDLMGTSFKHMAVKDGDTLDLGDRILRFIGAPNLHWPDSIYTYLSEDKLLFSCDSFGCHYSHPEMFDDKVGNFGDAFKYYFDVILGPYSKFMLKAIEKIQGLDIRMICPGHGPILRTRWKEMLDLSKQYAEKHLENPKRNRILVAFVSAYGNTLSMAKKVAEGARSADPGIEVDLCDLEHLPVGIVDHKISEASGIIVGSPIINQNILPQIYQLFGTMSPIRDRGKLAGAFGSYGWSGEFTKMIESNLLNLKLEFFGEGIFTRFTPHEDALQHCFEYGRDFAIRLNQQKNKD